MQLASKARQLARVLRSPSPILLNSDRVYSHSTNAFDASSIFLNRYFATLSSAVQADARYRTNGFSESSIFSSMPRVALYFSEASRDDGAASEAVRELYDKLKQSIAEKRSAPPNAWLWSMIAKCANVDDINLLFDVLHKLRVFRLTNLRIHENFNCALCQEVTRTCIRVGAIDYAKKSLWKHNVYGLTPTIGSAHHLLLHAQKHKDAKLASDIMKIVKKNDLPLQPGTADIVFSIWYDADKWNLISKYGKRFVKSGVKLRRTAFDMWMRSAAKRGDVDSLWKIEKFRSESLKQHSVASGLSCAKGFLLERKPESAAAIIQVLSQSISDAKRPGVALGLQELVSEWPLQVLKHQKGENKKALAAALREDIPAMIGHLSKTGVEANVNMEALTNMEGMLS